MFEKTIEDIVNGLIQVDIDAYFAYGEAINHINEGDREVRQQLENFQKDHERHIENLSALLKEAGGKPIEYSKDLKGQIIQGFTWLRSITGTVGALNAMVTNEKITNASYQEALEHKDLTSAMREQIQKNFADEKRHLAYVEKKLSEIKAEAHA